jgi:adenosylmethionine-8-amino-7-oxononanoate aminotransferase
MAIGPETATLGAEVAETELGRLARRGLICRADDRGEPVIQLSPPLIADTEEFELMHDALHAVFTQAWDRIAR